MWDVDCSVQTIKLLVQLVWQDMASLPGVIQDSLLDNIMFKFTPKRFSWISLPSCICALKTILGLSSNVLGTRDLLCVTTLTAEALNSKL